MADVKVLNREAWLNRMAEMLRPWFREHGYPIHGRISVGMAVVPKWGLCRHQRFDRETMMHHIFVTPYEDGRLEDPVNAAGILCHELLHSILPFGTKHSKPFKEACDAIKLVPDEKEDGKGYRATLPSAELYAHLKTLVDALPPIPRYGLRAPAKKARASGGPKGMFKYQCFGCKTTVYIKYTSLNRAGIPKCWNEECELYQGPMDDVSEPDTGGRS